MPKGAASSSGAAVAHSKPSVACSCPCFGISHATLEALCGLYTVGTHSEPLWFCGVNNKSTLEALCGVQGLMSREDWDAASAAAMQLFDFGQQEAAKRGLLLVDTKYEFGRDAEGNVRLIDEIHTPDSSRYWVADSYEARHAAGEVRSPRIPGCGSWRGEGVWRYECRSRRTSTASCFASEPLTGECRDVSAGATKRRRGIPVSPSP